MTFPACSHALKIRRAGSHHVGTLRWLAAEPFRLFFLSGTLLGIAGVVLWPFFYLQWLAFYPGISHARVMIEGFGGGFVLGFLGTAGPRILSAPKLTPLELMSLFALHFAAGTSHLLGMKRWGDALFIAALLLFATCLGWRMLFRAASSPPPAMLLAAIGLACGCVGALLWLLPASLESASLHRLAGLLLYHGFLLGPVMGVGSFLFPRLLGGGFGDPADAVERRRAWRRTTLIAIGLLASFAVEVWCHAITGVLLRATVFALALAGIAWRRPSNAAPAGTLANALRGWCLPLALAGIVAPALSYPRHTGLEHLFFVSGIGLLCLIVGSRVLFGHSGMLSGFAHRSWIARILVALVVIAAFTRMSVEIWPTLIVSHHIYAALLWAIASGMWLFWHARRFFKKDPDAD
jgi:uncharacterized protein involved in response to NO